MGITAQILSSLNDMKPWVLDTTLYSHKTFTYSNTCCPNSMRFNSDGTKLFVSIATTGYCKIGCFTLGTAWDISTACSSWEATYFNTGLIGTLAIWGLYIKSDGTKLYLVAGNTIRQYSFGVAWDVSTLVYDDISFSTSTQDASPRGLNFSSDGLNMYITGDSSDTVYQYTLGTAWNVSTAEYASKSLLYSGQTLNGYGLTFNTDGTIMYITSYNADIYQYTLTSGWDLATASYASITYDLSSFVSTPYMCEFKSDGSKLYISGTSGYSIKQYSVGTPWNVSVITSDTKLLYVTPFISRGRFKSDGTIMYLFGNDVIYQFTLSTAWDITSQTYYNKNTISMGTPRNFYIKSDGTKLYSVSSTRYVYQYSFGTPWDISTLTYDSISYALGATYETTPYGIFFNSDGSSMYINGPGKDIVYQYTLSTPWNVSTSAYASKSFSTATEESGNTYDLWFNSDGTKMFIAGNTVKKCSDIHYHLLGMFQLLHILEIILILLIMVH